MNLISQYGKKFGIIGLSRTAIAAYKALVSQASEIICYDNNLNSCMSFQELYPNAEIVGLSDQRWTMLDRIIVSPGIPSSHQIFTIAQAHSINLTSDIDLLFEECQRANFIAITGTNGKSTTTALIAHILKISGLDYSAGGNIGNAALSLSLGSNGYVMELSSFQLELIKNLRTKISILLNITPDHLDRHLTMENYINAKKRLITEPIATICRIIGVDDDITYNIYQSFIKETNARIETIPISAIEIQTKGVAVLGDKIYDNMFEQSVLKIPQIKSLQGVHNKQNIAASYAACRLIGLTSEQIVSAMTLFQGLPYRMQYIGTVGNIEIYNDSKATNADAAAKSISTLDNIYWLAGGIAKAGGIEALKPLFHKVKKAYLFGQDKELFAKTLSEQVPTFVFHNLQEAFEQAFSDALKYQADHVASILLAPAASSFDQFKSFEHRGELFTKLSVEKLNHYASLK